MTRSKRATFVIFLAVLMFGAAVIPDIISGDIEAACKGFFGENYKTHLAWILVLIVLLTTFFTTDFGSGLFKKTIEKTDPKPADISHFYPKIKDYLKGRYLSRLRQKLAHRQPVNLRRLPSDYGTSEESSILFHKYDGDEIQAEMAQCFDDAGGRLLVVGAPGAGKTTLLLQLVLHLLGAEADALPALVNLAIWKKKFADLEPWLREILPAELGVNKTLAAQILKQGRLILLFDGFDEIREEDRPSCLEAIGRYGVAPERKFVISSRKEEYRQVANDAPVNGQMEVGPLDFGQVEAELERQGHGQPEALRLLGALRQDALLREVAQVPFYFNTLQLLFASGRRLSDLHFTEQTLAGRQREIVERFAADALVMPAGGKYTAEEAERWLGFLASRMDERDKVVFELVDLQYDWWGWGSWQRVGAGLVGGLVGGLVFGLFGGLLFGLVIGLLFGLFVGLLFGLVGGLVSGLPSIKTKDEIKWSFINFSFRLK